MAFWTPIYFSIVVFLCVQSEQSVHLLMSKAERRLVFGSDKNIPEYELVQPKIEFQDDRQRRNVHQFREDQEEATVALTMKGKVVKLHLIRQRDLMSDSLKIEEWEKNERVVRSLLDHPQCHYHGIVMGVEGSSVALSHCAEDEMRGIVNLSPAEQYVLVPVPRRLRVDRAAESLNGQRAHNHILYKKSMDHFCGSNYASLGKPLFNSEELTHETSTFSRHRRRRGDSDESTSPTMETAVFIDDTLYAVMEEENPDDPIEAILSMVFAMINAVQIIYSQPSLSVHIRFVLIKIVIMKPGSNGPSKEEGDIRSYLKTFCTWQAKYNPRSDDNEDHWDHALMLTGTDLYMDDPDNTVVIGLAWVSGMCYKSYSCSLNEGTTFESVYVISHELGHNLGMHHDGEQNNTCSDKDFIMSSSLGPGKTTWSTCSDQYLLEFLETDNSKCLDDFASIKKDLDYRSPKLPGQLYPASVQCNLTFGNKYKPYLTDKEPFEDLCRELWCANGTLARRAHPALVGTKCGFRKMCLHGQCSEQTEVMSVMEESNIFPEDTEGQNTANSIS